MRNMQDYPAHGIRIGECFEFGWRTFKAQIASQVLVTFVLLVGMGMAQGALALASPTISFAGSALLSGLFMGGLANCALVAASGREPTLDDAFAPFKARQGDYLIVGLAVCAGAILCGIGYIITSFLFLFAPLLSVLGRDFKAALIQSKDLVLTHAADVAILYLVVAALSVAGFIACGVGLFVTTPISMLMIVRAHQQLTEPAGVLSAAVEPPPPPPPSPAPPV